ncbi:hypothetical protein [Kitasatospora sp. NPDC093806]|uniref:hypothetical protein n=1 Tax=Kitasatospora sp. NPDC093806 TaxID=3155075 RepID=UPI003433E09A
MTTSQRPEPMPFSRAQKDGRACIACEGEAGELVADGYVYLPDLPGLGWLVVAHPACRPTAPEEEQ